MPLRFGLVALVLISLPAQAADPAAERASFKIAPGFRVELVAAEPLVEAPVAMAFDGDGRLFVVEMRGFMPDADGKGEDQPTGRVSVLHDRDGDGRADARTSFLEGLVLPRSIAFTNGGVLIAAPPELIFCRDDDHDDRCDRPEIVARDYGTRKNPEHDANGLVPALDNWLYSANLGQRHRFVNGQLVAEPTLTRGQWGIAQDDVGRLVYNANSDYLRGDRAPVYLRAAHLRGSRGQNQPLDEDQTTWPGRPNYGVNRGYQDGSLRADGTLAKFTAACGPTIYRGDQFPAQYRGDAFVAEPAANFVRRSVVDAAASPDGPVSAHNAHEKGEFLTSSDERFRPVNLTTGPDGALYLADFYRGLIQHRIYLTPFLRQQVIARGLDRPIDQGRIWRIVSEAAPLAAPLRLQKAAPAALVAALAHENGFWRDTAQRLLVERGDVKAAPALLRLLRTTSDPRVKLHALFALDGLGQVTPALIARLQRDGDAFVRAAATGLGERGAELALARFAHELATQPHRSVARYRGRELDLVRRLLDDPALTEDGKRAALLGGLARTTVAAGKPDDTLALVELVAAEPAPWRQLALLDGIAAGRSGERAGLPDKPRGFARLLRSKDAAVKARALALGPWLGLPGEATRAPAPTSTRGLDADERARFARGKALYPGICGACHQPSGLGEEGKGPPLVESAWVLGTPERLVRIALHGLRGPIEVGKRTYTMEMPAMGGLSDAQLAELLTYVRNESDWGHDAPAIDVATVARIRAATAAREQAWTAAELGQLAPR